MTPKQKIERKRLLTTAYRNYSKGMHSYAFFKLHNRAAGQDAVQDTFMKTWKYLVRRGKVDTMRSFLYHVLNQLIIDEYRKNNEPCSLDSLLEKGFQPSIDESQRLSNIFDGKAVLLLIERLPEKYRVVMRMRYVKGLSLKEISRITGQSRNALAVQTHRGLVKLRVLYNNQN